MSDPVFVILTWGGCDHRIPCEGFRSDEIKRVWQQLIENPGEPIKREFLSLNAAVPDRTMRLILAAIGKSGIAVVHLSAGYCISLDPGEMRAVAKTHRNYAMNHLVRMQQLRRSARRIEIEAKQRPLALQQGELTL